MQEEKNKRIESKKQMSHGTKFARMVALLKADDEARKKFIEDPEAVLKEMGLQADDLDRTHDDEALRRSENLLSRAGLTDTDSAVTNLKKLGKAAHEVFPRGFAVEVEPYAVSLLERPQQLGPRNWTATGTVNCTWSPWDGCTPDVDG